MFTGNVNWDLDMPIQEDGLSDHHTQLSFDQLWTENYPIQPHHAPSSSYSRAQAQIMLSENANRLLPEGEKQEEAQQEPEDEPISPMKEMVYKIAAMQPVEIDPATIPKPKRRKVRISNDPPSVSARLRREKISEKIRILQRLVPEGTKMDTADMLDEATRYIKFLKRQLRQFQGYQVQQHPSTAGSSWQVQPGVPVLGNFCTLSTSGELSLLQPLGHNLALEANKDAIPNTFSFKQGGH